MGVDDNMNSKYLEPDIEKVVKQEISIKVENVDDSLVEEASANLGKVIVESNNVKVESEYVEPDTEKVVKREISIKVENVDGGLAEEENANLGKVIVENNNVKAVKSEYVENMDGSRLEEENASILTESLIVKVK